MDSATINEIVQTLFTSDSPKQEIKFKRVRNVPLFNDKELEIAVISQQKHKAPDGILNETLKEVYNTKADFLLHISNASLSQVCFLLRYAWMHEQDYSRPSSTNGSPLTLPYLSSPLTRSQ
ncbi:hypothetical protein J6590_051015, partial [Homalodisca vitripennis]